LGQEVVKQLVRSLIEEAIHTTLMAVLGPCDGALASSALSTLQGLASMRSPDVPALPGGLPGEMPVAPSGVPAAIPNFPGFGGGAAGEGAAAMGGVLGGAAIGSALGGIGLPSSGETRVADLPPFMREMVQGMVDDQMRERREDQRKRGLTREQIEAEDRAQDDERRELLASLKELQSARPLSPAEIDQFVDRYGRLSKLMPGDAACSPESLRRVFTLTPVAWIPMAAGSIRTMNNALGEMDAQFAEARRIYEAMTPVDRSEHIRLMEKEIEHWEDEDRDVFAKMIESDMLGLPADMRAALLKRLRER